MYGYRWAGSLEYKYCRTKHYLLGSIVSDSLFSREIMSYGEKIMFDGSDYPALFFVGICYDPDTYEITGFDCMCEWDQNTGHFRPSSTERPVSSEDKQHFYRHFEKHVTKDSAQARESWK